MVICFIVLYVYYQYAQFPEQIYRHADECESEWVARRGDYGTDDEYDDNGMSAVLLHEVGLEHAYLGQQPAHHGKLKDDAHKQAQYPQHRDIAAEGDGVGHLLAHLVAPEEAHCEGEDDEVVECHTGHKEQISAAYGAQRQLSLGTV